MGSGGGGGYQTPVSIPPPQSIGSAISDYLAALPQLLAAEQQYAPQFAELQRSLESRFYPYTAGLQEQLAQQAAEGINAETPDWMRNEYISNIRAASGENVGSPIAADYESTGLLRLKEDYRNYFRNLGLNVTGRLPLTGYQSVALSGVPAATQYATSNYGSYVNALANQPIIGGRRGGGWMGALGGAGGGGALGYLMGGWPGLAAGLIGGSAYGGFR